MTSAGRPCIGAEADADVLRDRRTACYITGVAASPSSPQPSTGYGARRSVHSAAHRRATTATGQPACRHEHSSRCAHERSARAGHAPSGDRGGHDAGPGRPPGPTQARGRSCARASTPRRRTSRASLRSASRGCSTTGRRACGSGRPTSSAITPAPTCSSSTCCTRGRPHGPTSPGQASLDRTNVTASSTTGRRTTPCRPPRGTGCVASGPRGRVCDISRDQGEIAGRVAAESALRTGTSQAELESIADGMTSWPYVTVVKDVNASASPKTDSVGETLAALLVTSLGSVFRSSSSASPPMGGRHGATSASAGTCSSSTAG